MILNDIQIARLARKGMIRPFTPRLVRRSGARRVLSHGLCSFGYDLRLSPKEFQIFRHVPGTVADPKAFSMDKSVMPIGRGSIITSPTASPCRRPEAGSFTGRDAASRGRGHHSAKV